MASPPLTATVASFLAVTLLVALFSWWRTRRMDNTDARTYFLADRRLPWIQVAGSLLLTNLSTEQLIGLNGAASVHGAVVMAWEIVAVFGLIAMAWYFLPRYWSGNITTLPEFLERRFDRATRRLLGAILLITIAFNVLPFVIYSGSVAMSSIFHVPERLGLTPGHAFALTAVVIGVLGCSYVVLGGMKAVALSDTLYGGGLLTGALLIPVFALRYLGHGHLHAGFAAVVADQGGQFNPIGGPTSNVPFSTLFTGMLVINLFYWCTNQVIVQRSFGARSFAEAQKGILATAGLKLLGPFFLVLPGIIAAKVLGKELVGNGDFAYGRLVGLVLPDYLVGFFAAVLFGSILSAFNGALHSAATLFGIDIYRGWLRPQASERAMLVAGKIFAVGVCIAAVLCSGLLGNAPEGVFTLMKRIMAAFKIPVLAVVAMGMVNPRVPAWAAKTALIAGVASAFALDAVFGYGRYGITIHWLHLAAINGVLLCIGMALAGRWSPAPVVAPPVRSLSQGAAGAPAPDLVPWPGLRRATFLTTAGAVGVYVLFWQLSRAR